MAAMHHDCHADILTHAAHDAAVYARQVDILSWQCCFSDAIIVLMHKC